MSTVKKTSQQALRQPESRPKSGARSVGKPNAPREGDGYHCGRKTPQSEEVREIDPRANTGAASKAFKTQNAGNVIPVTLEQEEAIAKARSKQ